MGNIRIEIPRDKITEFCKKWKVTEFSLFGSVLTEHFSKDSDIDVLIAFNESARHSLFDLVKMEIELEEIFGRKVDLVSRRAIESSHNYLRKNAILETAEAVYAA
jgi:predicted nucleotidyltransferase